MTFRGGVVKGSPCEGVPAGTLGPIRSSRNECCSSGKQHNAMVGEGDGQPRDERRPAVVDEDGFPVVPKYRQRTWEGLSRSEQGAVLRAARRGESHPDPAIVKAARDWAQGVLAPSAPARGPLNILLRILEDPFGGTLGQMFGERRAARRILAVQPLQDAKQPRV